MFVGSVLCVCGLVTASMAPTGTRQSPMMVINVPVTTGGKNFSSLMKIGAMRNVKTPATITAPVHVQQTGRAAAMGQPDRDDGGGHPRRM